MDLNFFTVCPTSRVNFLCLVSKSPTLIEPKAINKHFAIFNCDDQLVNIYYHMELSELACLQTIIWLDEVGIW